MIVTWEREGARASFFGVRETASGKLRALTPADVAAFLAAYVHRKDEPTSFAVVDEEASP